MTRGILDYLGFFITTIGTLLGFYGIYLSIHSNTSIVEVLKQLNAITFYSSIILFFVSVLLLYKYIFHSRYTNSYETISHGFTTIHKLKESEKIKSLPECILCLQDFCTLISNAFSKMSNRSSFVCIKLFHIAENGDICLKTLCRDIKSKEDKNRINPEEDDNLHYLSENTDFKYIFENVNKDGEEYKYFFSNSLPFDDHYLNSRIENYECKSIFPLVKEIKKFMAWKLPYKSTITVPITPLTDKKINENQIVGYLCVDSNFLWAYNKKYDVNIFRGIADGLYPIMKQISDLHFLSVHTATKQKQKKIKP